MTCADDLPGRALSSEDQTRRAQLMHRVTGAFERLQAVGPSWTWFVPGRLEVFGKHTDYAGGRALVAAVPRGFAVAAGPRDDGRVRAFDVRSSEQVTFDIAGTERLTGWGSYLQVTARRLASNFPGAPLGLDLVFASDLPRAAGLSSSSALVVATATALSTRAGLASWPEWRTHVRTTEDLASYLGCVENGQTFGALVGTGGVGTHGGSEDHTAILDSRAGWLRLYRFAPVRHLADISWPQAWSFVVATTGVHADKAGSVRERYNRASAAARALLDLWNASAGAHAHAPSLAAALALPGAAQTLRALASRGAAEFTGDALRDRLDHFVAEDAIADLGASAVARCDLSLVGDLARRSQQHAERWLGNQVPETADMAALAYAHGAHAATSFGAGFGGSVWALVDASAAAAFGATWTQDYTTRHARRAPVEWFVARPGPGLAEIDPSREGAGHGDGRLPV